MLERLPRRPLTPADYARMECQLPHVPKEPRSIQLGSQATVVRQFRLSVRKPNGKESVVRFGYFENNLMLAQNDQNKPLLLDNKKVKNLAQQSPALHQAIQYAVQNKDYYDQIFATVGYELLS